MKIYNKLKVCSIQFCTINISKDSTVVKDLLITARQLSESLGYFGEKKSLQSSFLFYKPYINVFYLRNYESKKSVSLKIQHY
ncbi:hypothetical protein HNR53_004653 [Bacillus benzoevorans]|uniref:Uncharacterized protein n=1 Tax=Bacillus benzoevorans TaxID=1456 RepID=A0A7X0HWA9_9BACI|nr:hypothetical protein [Bacillus benzoevorans]